MAQSIKPAAGSCDRVTTHNLVLTRQQIEDISVDLWLELAAWPNWWDPNKQISTYQVSPEFAVVFWLKYTPDPPN